MDRITQQHQTAYNRDNPESRRHMRPFPVLADYPLKNEPGSEQNTSCPIKAIVAQPGSSTICSVIALLRNSIIELNITFLQLLAPFGKLSLTS